MEVLRLIRQLVAATPRHPDLFEICARYVQEFEGDNNPDPQTNGELRALRELLPSCGVAFDIGANHGDWTRLALGVNPALAIHAFEPAAAAFETYRANRFPAQVTAHRLALGAAPEQRELYHFPGHPDLSSFYPRETLDGPGLAAPRTAERVEVTTIDGFCASRAITRIDYLKIDAEGHDLPVLRGAERMIASQAVRYIQFEYGRTNIDSRILLKDLFAFFEPFGHELFKLMPDGFAPHPRYGYGLETFQYQNWIAVSPQA